MNESSNAPFPGNFPATPEPFHKVWLNALTKPSETTFTEIAASPQAKQSTAFLWVFIAYVVNFFLTSLVQTATMRPLMEQMGIDPTLYSGGIGQTLISAICGAPVGAAFGTVMFAIGVYLFQWIARMFGGRGNADQLAYALAAIVAPFSILSGLLSLLAAIPYVGLCFSLVILLAGLYVLYLEVLAIKSVNQISWGSAIATLFIPLLVIGCLCFCVFLVLGMALGTAFGDVFSTIAPNLGGY